MERAASAGRAANDPLPATGYELHMENDPAPFVVFYAWQSDVDQPNTTTAIRAALRLASNRLEQDLPIRVILDEATRKVSGSPYVPFEIARKIQGADVFVADITTVYKFPKKPAKSLPNPNVAFETGIAAAHLGWSRVILLFNTQVAEFSGLPFDFDRHRISKFTTNASAKRPEGKVAELASLLEGALREILADRPKRPRELEGKSDEEIKKSRDQENIEWLMRQFSVPSLGIHIRDQPEMRHYFAPFMYDSVMAVLSRPDFRLYDKKAKELVEKFAEDFSDTLEFDHLYRELRNNYVQAFGRRDEFRSHNEETEAAAMLRRAGKRLATSLDQLIEYVRNEYIAINLDETSAIAGRAYKKAIKADDDD